MISKITFIVTSTLSFFLVISPVLLCKGDSSSTRRMHADEPHQTITLCGCPNVSTACQACGTFDLNECAPFYNCFDEARPFIAYVKPVLKNEIDQLVTINTYTNDDCTTPLEGFDEANSGWEGSCGNTCWSEDVSKMGAKECDLSAAIKYDNNSRLYIMTLSVLVVAWFF